MIKNQQKIEQIAGVALVVAIVAGCGLVMRPFTPAILWAAVLCFATWPVHEVVLRFLRGRRNLAAGLTTLALLLVLFIPILIVGLTFTESVSSALQWLDAQQQEGMISPPAWVANIPLVGKRIADYWSKLATDAEPILTRMKPWLQAAGIWLLKHSIDFAQGVFQLAVSVLIAFFMYRDGEGVVMRLREAAQRISGGYSQHLLDVVRMTIRSVVYGAIGTALAQGGVAGVGFAVAGVPSPVLLAMFTFFLSFIPLGPPLVWVGAAVWLFSEGRTGWGIFMVIYGLAAISSIDNFIKPYIISRSSKLPFIVMFIGVLGGVVAFGFIGVFLGPTLLAVGYSLMHEIITKRSPAAEGKAPADSPQAT